MLRRTPRLPPRHHQGTPPIINNQHNTCTPTGHSTRRLAAVMVAFLFLFSCRAWFQEDFNGEGVPERGLDVAVEWQRACSSSMLEGR
jgi:hypothetical protein